MIVLVTLAGGDRIPVECTSEDQYNRPVEMHGEANVVLSDAKGFTPHEEPAEEPHKGRRKKADGRPSSAVPGLP